MGCPPGQNTVYYNLVKSLLERIAPVMIDTGAVNQLVKQVAELLSGLGPLADVVDKGPEKGVKLLLVGVFLYSICYSLFSFFICHI